MRSTSLPSSTGVMNFSYMRLRPVTRVAVMTGQFGGALLERLVAGVEHDGVKVAVLAVGGQQAVGRGGVIVDRVAGAEDLGVIAQLDLQMAADDDVQLLAFVCG